MLRSCLWWWIPMLPSILGHAHRFGSGLELIRAARLASHRELQTRGDIRDEAVGGSVPWSWWQVVAILSFALAASLVTVCSVSIPLSSVSIPLSSGLSSDTFISHNLRTLFHRIEGRWVGASCHLGCGLTTRSLTERDPPRAQRIRRFSLP